MCGLDLGLLTTVGFFLFAELPLPLTQGRPIFFPTALFCIQKAGILRERERECEWERERERETHTQRERKSERETQSERERVREER